MTARTAYLHVLDGRLRIKIAEAKKAPAAARRVEQHFRSIEGVDHVSANPTTGNVLVLFDQRRTDQTRVLDAIRSLGCLSGLAPAAKKGIVTAEKGVVGKVAETVAKGVMELALQRLVAALI